MSLPFINGFSFISVIPEQQMRHVETMAARGIITPYPVLPLADIFLITKLISKGAVNLS